MQLAKAIWVWMFRRLPRLYSVLFLLLALPYYLFAFPRLVYVLSPRLAEHAMLGGSYTRMIFERFGVERILSSVFTFCFAAAGIVIANFFAAWIYGLLRSRKHRSYPPVRGAPPGSSSAEGLLERYQRIGIILAGGGAKGAYQAGALKAIHEFLAREDALSKVKMIAGTSIGSWNALFWLAESVNPGTGCDIERWWSAMDVPSIVEPIPYIPGLHNYVLSTAPWRDEFDRLFGGATEWGRCLARHLEHPDAASSIHFYFTRSNVGQARLELTTNNPAVGATAPNLSGGPRSPVESGTYKIATMLEDIKEGVFSSMDLPPLFRYTRIGDQYFEDGGVVDNLPIRFGTEIEHCDLLFVLPLNATFAESVNQNSLFMRLYRVMEIRQGLLERNSFKLLYLYNELAALREALRESDELLVRSNLFSSPSLGGLPETAEKAIRDARRRLEDTFHAAGNQSQARALRRKNPPVHVFSVCPAPDLQVNTAEFWKTEQAGHVFRMMREVTAEELTIHFRNPPEAVEMVLVSPTTVSRFTNF